MKFPTSRTQLLDAVASTVTNPSLDNLEMEKRIKLTLIHWNHVADKSLPDLPFDGFDATVESPVNNVDLNQLKSGAKEYLFERAGVLNEQLFDISKQIYTIENSGMSDVGNDPAKVMRINKLLNDKADIVQSLQDVGYTAMDRKVEFTFDDAFVHVGKNADDIGPFFESKLNDMVQDFEALGTVSVEIKTNDFDHDLENRIVTVTVHVPNTLVADLVERVNQLVYYNREDVFQNTFDDKEEFGPSVKIEKCEDAVPNFKDTHDMGLMIPKKEAYLQSKKNDEDDLSLSM